MKKQKLTSYYFLFFLAFLLILTGVFFFYRNWSDFVAEKEQNTVLDSSAHNLNQQITAMLTLTHQDFQYLLEEEGVLLFDALEAQRNRQDMHLFITDHNGKIQTASFGAPHGTLSARSVSLATDKGRGGQNFVSDLDGFYPEQRVFRAVVLEKEHSQTHRQRVGLILISLPQSFTNTAMQKTIDTLFILSLAALFLLALGLFWIHVRFLRPLHALDRASEAFAKGDFSLRLPEENSGSITPIFRTYNQLIETVEKNEAARQTFVSNISHDLRTPLTTISGFVQNMLQGTIPPERLSHYYKIILDEVDRLGRLVQTLLETSRMASGERKYNFAPMDLCELSRITLLSFEKRLEEKQIEVMFFSSQDSIFVRADQDAIQQVVYNLMDNAIKFTPPQGRLSLEIVQQEKKVFFAITNSGDGIPEEELSNLFDRFYKSDRSRGLDKKGMGLGLFIAKSIINAHGEELWVESKVGSYTQFVFSLEEVKQKTKKIKSVKDEE